MRTTLLGVRWAALPLLLLAANLVVARPLPYNTRVSGEGLDPSVVLSSPIPGARISSPFGWRVDPALKGKRRRFHGAVDFEAALGTPVLSAGNGVVETIATRPDFGLYVIVRHSDRTETAYSHLSALSADLHEGQPVLLGDDLGRVGRSGRATGPHLDFQVFVDGKRIDPQLKLPRAAAHAVQASMPPPRSSSLDGASSD